MHFQTVYRIIACRGTTLVMAKFNYLPQWSTKNLSNLLEATKILSETEIQSQVSLSFTSNFLSHRPFYFSGSSILHLLFFQTELALLKAISPHWSTGSLGICLASACWTSDQKIHAVRTLNCWMIMGVMTEHIFSHEYWLAWFEDHCSGSQHTPKPRSQGQDGNPQIGKIKANPCHNAEKVSRGRDFHIRGTVRSEKATGNGLLTHHLHQLFFMMLILWPGIFTHAHLPFLGGPSR